MEIKIPYVSFFEEEIIESKDVILDFQPNYVEITTEVEVNVVVENEDLGYEEEEQRHTYNRCVIPKNKIYNVEVVRNNKMKNWFLNIEYGAGGTTIGFYTKQEALKVQKQFIKYYF